MNCWEETQYMLDKMNGVYFWYLPLTEFYRLEGQVLALLNFELAGTLNLVDITTNSFQKHLPLSSTTINPKK
jgi:hypothetical protein